MKKDQHVLVYVMFFGAIWGILEATLGYVLQFLPPLVSGSIMFPIAGTLMFLAYQNTKSKTSMIYVAAIAATIKSINFFMPGLPPIKTYNPMIAIMLQSLVMVVILPLVEKKPLSMRIFGIAMLGISWRLLFLTNISINNLLTGFPFSQLTSLSTMIEFVFYFGFFEALFLNIIVFGLMAVHRKTVFNFKPNLWISLTTCALAIVLTIFL